MPNYVTNIITLQGDSKQIEKLLSDIQKDELGIGSIDFNKIIPMPDEIFRGNLGVAETKLYGKNNWYDWSIANWQTKWNAFSFGISEKKNKIYFDTAWSAPHPILQKLSEKYPDLKITHRWSDENIGFNCGEYEYENGKIIGALLPDGGTVEAYNLAAAIHDLNLAEEGYQLSADGSEYIRSE